MVDIIQKVLTPAASKALLSVAEFKTLIGFPTSDTSHDAQFQMFIDQNSATIGTMTNRVNFGKERVRETWRCVAPVCCPDGSAKLYLLKYPVVDTDIETVESPEGSVLDPSGYELEEASGKLLIWSPTSSEIVVTYSGGYDLPTDAPDDLKMACSIMVREQRNAINRDATVGTGTRMLAHKDSRVMFFSPKDLAAATVLSATSATSAANVVKNLLAQYTHYWM